MRRPKDVLRKLIDDLLAIPDPAERGKAATEALDAFKDANAEVAVIRQAAARELKDQGLTYQQIADHFGPVGPDRKTMHFTRVRQIIQGGPTGRWARTARDTAAEDNPS